MFRKRPFDENSPEPVFMITHHSSMSTHFPKVRLPTMPPATGVVAGAEAAVVVVAAVVVAAAVVAAAVVVVATAVVVVVVAWLSRRRLSDEEELVVVVLVLVVLVLVVLVLVVLVLLSPSLNSKPLWHLQVNFSATRSRSCGLCRKIGPRGHSQNRLAWRVQEIFPLEPESGKGKFENRILGALTGDMELASLLS
jgi:hypothetical protein